jgi:hypothetical protein
MLKEKVMLEGKTTLKTSLSEKIKMKFKMSSYTGVKEWKDTTKCPLSLFTCTSVINQGKEPSIPSFITMAYLLGFTPGEIAAACKESGDTIFWRLVAPSDVSDASNEDNQMLIRIKALTPDRVKLVKDLLKTLGV